MTTPYPAVSSQLYQPGYTQYQPGYVQPQQQIQPGYQPAQAKWRKYIPSLDKIKALPNKFKGADGKWSKPKLGAFVLGLVILILIIYWFVYGSTNKLNIKKLSADTFKNKFKLKKSKKSEDDADTETAQPEEEQTEDIAANPAEYALANSTLANDINTAAPMKLEAKKG